MLCRLFPVDITYCPSSEGPLQAEARPGSPEARPGSPAPLLVSDAAQEAAYRRAVDQAVAVHEREPYDVGVLEFLSTPADCDRACEDFRASRRAHVGFARTYGGMAPSGQEDFLVFPLHGRLQPFEQQRVFQPLARPGQMRKIVFATNVAETSVTIPEVSLARYCSLPFSPFPLFIPIHPKCITRLSNNCPLFHRIDRLRDRYWPRKDQSIRFGMDMDIFVCVCVIFVSQCEINSN